MHREDAEPAAKVACPAAPSDMIRFSTNSPRPIRGGDVASPRSSLPTIASWLVHAYTASGLVLALLIVIAAIDGDAVRCLWLGLAALVIDGTDGMLARRLRVKETIPWFDGAMLDNIVDYLTYAFAPIVLLWSGGLPADTAPGARCWPRCRCLPPLPVLPGRREDRRPLLPRLPELLERGRVLRRRPRPQPVHHRRAAGVLGAGLRPGGTSTPRARRRSGADTSSPTASGCVATPYCWRRCPTRTRSWSRSRWPTSPTTGSSAST